MPTLSEKLTVILSYIWWLQNLGDLNFITWEKEVFKSPVIWVGRV